jgi:hypothetical protein
VFVIQMLDGEEIHATEGDQLTINPDTGVLVVHRRDGLYEATTHYSPAAWRSVTHRVKGRGLHSPNLSGPGASTGDGAPSPPRV